MTVVRVNLADCFLDRVTSSCIVLDGARNHVNRWNIVLKPHAGITGPLVNDCTLNALLLCCHLVNAFVTCTFCLLVFI